MGLRRARPGGKGVPAQGNHASDFFVGSAKCKAWSQLQNLSMDKQLFDAEKLVHSMRHMEAVTQMYHGQEDDHNYFLHEQSDRDEFWNEPSIQRILMRNGISWIRNGLVCRRLDCGRIFRADGDRMADELSMHCGRTCGQDIIDMRSSSEVRRSLRRPASVRMSW